MAAADLDSAWVLLDRLDFPRPNGSAGLEAARAVLDSALQASGWRPQALPFEVVTARPLVAAGFLAVAAALLAAAALRKTAAPRAWILASLLAALASFAGACDPLLPHHEQSALQVTLEPTGAAHRTLVLMAHYDSKTEALDHVGRALALGLALLGTGLALALRRPASALRRGVFLAAASAWVVVAANGVLPARIVGHSHGIVDDAGACVLLVALTTQLRDAPLHHVRLRCIWSSGEECGAQGSAALAKRAAARTGVDAIVNLEAIGAGPDVAVARFEAGHFGVRRADPAVRDRLQHAAGAVALRAIAAPLVTDAGPWLAAGFPGVTLLTLPARRSWIRGLHRPRDDRSQFVPQGWQRTSQLLLQFLREYDREATAGP